MRLNAWWCEGCLVMSWDQEKQACPLCRHSMTLVGWQESPEEASECPSEPLGETAGG
jgi:hypothetical protein